VLYWNRFHTTLATVQVGGRVGVWAFTLSGPEREREVIAGDRFVRPMCLRGDRMLFHATSILGPATSTWLSWAVPSAG
jgi:hypothetical protein